MVMNSVKTVFDQTRAIDMHTHLFPPSFGDMALCGVDELLTYHYLEAEYFRLRELSPEHYFSLRKPARAETIWDALFVRNVPISEATSDVVSILRTLGLDPTRTDLTEAREFFRSRDPEVHLNEIFELANLEWVVMTNDPLDEREANVWKGGVRIDRRFKSSLRLDSVINVCDTRWDSLCDVRSFLEDWAKRMKPLYMAISLVDLAPFTEQSTRGRLLREVVLPICRGMSVPLALMIGVKRGLNPRLQLAADGLSRADLAPLAWLCETYDQNRFLVTCLSLENQHELCALSRQFSNIMPFGCWWFVNISSIVRTITEQRLEMLGTTFVAQHSDARVLEQLICKWKDARCLIGEAYSNSYIRLCNEGYTSSDTITKADASKLLRRNFEMFCSTM
jgi:hypothetical protein